MAVELLDALAQAIWYYEGHHPGDRNMRNNNPGNLRNPTGGDHPADPEGYLIFESFTAGYQALLMDLQAKITGQNRHGLDQNSDLEEFFSVYAPSHDHNQPKIYAGFVAHWLGLTYGKVFYPTNSFSYILNEIGQKVG